LSAQKAASRSRESTRVASLCMDNRLLMEGMIDILKRALFLKKRADLKSKIKQREQLMLETIQKDNYKCS
jgi:hypothetical protein